MAVTLDETGNRHPAFELDDLGVGPGRRFDLRGGAHGGDPAVPNRHRFRFGMVGIHGDDPAAEQHQVGGAADVGGLRAAAECRGQGDGKNEKGQETHGIPPRKSAA